MAVSAASLAPKAFASTPSSSDQIEEDCTFDLYNLSASNVFEQRFDEAEWENSGDDDDDENEGEDEDVPRNAAFERFLLDKATAGTTQLISALWTLPTAPSDEGPLAQLPGTSYFLPRAKAPPAPKEDSKWEQFAKEKGIEQRKRGRKEWNEEAQEWTARYGMDSKSDKDTAWPIMEASKDDPYADPWELARDVKKAKVEKNQVQQTKNLEKAGVLPKGAGRKLEKEQKAKREQTKKQQEQSRIPAGVPVDVKSGKASTVNVTGQRGAASTQRALELTRQSTASMGKFDEVKRGESVKKKSSEQQKDKRKSIKAAIVANGEGEEERSKKILGQVLTGSAKKEKFRKSGKMSEGETAYDHEYGEGDDKGYRKKKGAAGQGKMRKANKGMLKPKMNTKKK